MLILARMNKLVKIIKISCFSKETQILFNRVNEQNCHIFPRSQGRTSESKLAFKKTNDKLYTACYCRESGSRRFSRRAGFSFRIYFKNIYNKVKMAPSPDSKNSFLYFSAMFMESLRLGSQNNLLVDARRAAA